MKRISQIISLFIAMMVFGSTFLAPAVASAAGRATCYIYQIEMRGAASGNPFHRTGLLAIVGETASYVTGNDTNPFEFWLLSGSPVVQPQTGAIVLTSNSAYRSGLNGNAARSRIDMVNMSASSSLMTASLDPNISAIGVNHFNSSSGLLGAIYMPYRGDVTLRLSDNATRISGSMDLTGRGAYYYTNVRYTATFSGTYLGSTSSCQIPDYM